MSSCKLLIVKTSSIGDVIHSLPLIGYLKERFPDAEIDWVVEKPSFDLLSAHTALNQVFLADIKRWKKKLLERATWQEVREFWQALQKKEYDYLFDLQGNSKSAWITCLARAKVKVGFGWKTLAEKLNYFVTDERFEVSRALPVQARYLMLAKRYFKDESPIAIKGSHFHLKEEELLQLEALLPHPLMGSSLKLMVAFGSYWKNKQLTESTLIRFLQAIAHKYQAVFFFPFGNREEELFAHRLHALFPDQSLIIGKLSLPLWQGLMQRMQGVISMDSAALHLAATTKTPTFSFFGPSLLSVFKPVGEEHASFQGGCPYGRSFHERCPELRSCPTGACLRGAPLEQLLASCERWISTLSSGF